MNGSATAGTNLKFCYRNLKQFCYKNLNGCAIACAGLNDSAIVYEKLYDPCANLNGFDIADARLKGLLLLTQV